MWQNGGKRAYDLHSAALYRSVRSSLFAPTPASINDSRILQSEPDNGPIFRSPTPERDTVSFWGPIGKTHPVLGRKLGRVGRSYAKIAAAGLAIGLALALCAPFATYRSEQSFIDGAENGFGIDVILSWVQEHLDGCEDPRRASNGKQLQGTDSGWRWRVGVYRILARIEDGKAVIEVVRVGHRQGVYKSMPRL